MHLRYRCGCQWIGVKFGETIIKRLAQRALYPLYRFFCWKRCDLVLQQRQLVGNVMGEQISPR